MFCQSVALHRSHFSSELFWEQQAYIVQRCVSSVPHDLQCVAIFHMHGCMMESCKIIELDSTAIVIEYPLNFVCRRGIALNSLRMGYSYLFLNIKVLQLDHAVSTSHALKLCKNLPILLQ
jgi:hypothetical protein